MMFSPEALSPSIARCLSLWERGLLTRQEALDRLLEKLVFTLESHPESRQKVVAAIGAIPPSIAADLVGWLAERRASGVWEWPPTGAIGTGAMGAIGAFHFIHMTVRRSKTSFCLSI